MTTELTAESTHEDITAAVDSIIEDRKGTEVKGDAQKIAEERDEPVGDTSAEIDSGSEDTAPEGEDTGEDQGPKWLDDDLKAELTAYGIDEKGLADFSSREELERAMRFFDKSALEAGRKALAEGEGETPVSDEKKVEPKAKEGQYEISLDKDIYDENLVDELTRMRDHYESRLGTLETRLAQADATALEQTFDTYVDALGFPELFGKTGKENQKQHKIREDLLVDCLAHREGMKLFGRTVDLDQSLVLRVARSRYADAFTKKEWKAKTRSVSEQSNGRQGGGAIRPSDPAESLRDEMRRLYKEKENAG